MRKWLMIVLIAGFAFISTGCMTYIALWSRPRHTPAYCYDCHYRPGWVRVFIDCDYYVFRNAKGGYYYKPRNVKHAKYEHKKYDEKIVRKRQKEHAEELKKHKKSKEEKEKSSKKKPRGSY